MNTKKVRCLVCGKETEKVIIGTYEAITKCSCGAVCFLHFGYEGVEFETEKDSCSNQIGGNGKR